VVQAVPEAEEGPAAIRERRNFRQVRRVHKGLRAPKEP
jgi:hypothetical protein